MALQRFYIDTRGTDFGQQYYRVDSIETTKTSMRVLVGVYFSEQAAKDGQPPHTGLNVEGDFDMYSSENLWQQAYAHAKRYWPDAVDV